MMITLKPVIVCVITLLLSLILKSTAPHIVTLLTISAGILVTLYILPFVKNIMIYCDFVNNIDQNIAEIVKITVKIVIISIICEFAAELCYDSNQSYLAGKIIFSGKIIIINILLPYLFTFIKNMIESVNGL